jgi:hypothetical protein
MEFDGDGFTSASTSADRMTARELGVELLVIALVALILTGLVFAL